MNFKFKENARPYTDEFWYDLTDGGYIVPSGLLENEEDIKKINEAIELIRKFEDDIYEIMEYNEEREDSYGD